MFERYTEKARRVIFFSRAEASELGALSIEPHHILLGLIREDKQLIRRFCTLTPTPIDDIGNKIRSRSGLTAKLAKSADMPISPQAMKVLTYAADESKQLNHRHIGTEHLLLGLLREEQTTASEILVEQGLDLIIVRDELRDEFRGKSTGEACKEGELDELRRLAVETRNLATAMLRKAERIEAICDQLTNGKDT